MKQPIVAFQGERGANSEDAVIRFFGEVDVLPCPTLYDVFQAVEKQEADYALIPSENSHAGTIVDTYDLLLTSNLHVFGELDLPVRHSLQALPGQKLSDIKQVFSHPQALAQCSKFLSELGVETIAVYDTAGSAKMVAEQSLRGAAAIASKRAASIYGLEVLREDIQDSNDNVTKFYAVRPRDGDDGWLRKPEQIQSGHVDIGAQTTGANATEHTLAANSTENAREQVLQTKQARTVIVLGTEDRPAALYWCLGALAYRNINLLKLESRPNRVRPWEYNFYLVLATHLEDENCQKALAELQTKTTMLRVLGSYFLEGEE